MIACYFKSKGHNILPVYEIEKHTGKGPQVFNAKGSLIAPDMLIWRFNKCFWIEAKHKSAFAWNRKYQIWTTGIDLKHWEHYQEVSKISKWPVYILFLHRGGQAKDSPVSEGGLFGGEIKYLMKNEHHRCDAEKWGNKGMVYWNKDDLHKYASLEKVESIFNSMNKRA